MTDCTCSNFPNSLGNVTFGGNIGVGTTAPDTILNTSGLGPTIFHVKGGTRGQLVAEGTSYGILSLIDDSATVDQRWYDIWTTGGLLRISKNTDSGNTTDLMTIDNNGRVGIGTTNPSGSGLAIGGSNVGGIVLGIQASDASAVYINDTTTGNKFGLIAENDSRGNFSSIGSVSKNDLAIKTNNIERITVSGDGDSTIHKKGTATPGITYSSYDLKIQASGLVSDAEQISTFTVRNVGNNAGPVEGPGEYAMLNILNTKGIVVFTIWDSHRTVGIGTTSPSITGSGKLHVSGDTARVFDATNTPSSSSASGYIGEMRFDSNYLYICVTSNTWKRIALASF